MTPEQKIKYTIITQAIEAGDYTPEEPINPNDVDDEWRIFKNTGEAGEYKYIFRSGEVETHLSCEYSRHYEAKSVAAKMFDGSWVGWTYWYGGGKWGEPEAIDWMEDAYFVNCIEEKKLVVIQTFTKVD